MAWQKRIAQKTVRPLRLYDALRAHQIVIFETPLAATKHPWPQRQPQAAPMLRVRSKVQSGRRPRTGRGLQPGKRCKRTLPTRLMSRKRTLLEALVVLKTLEFSSRRFRRAIANIVDRTQSARPAYSCRTGPADSIGVNGPTGGERRRLARQVY